MLWIVFALAVVLWTVLLASPYFKKMNAEQKATLVLESAATSLSIFLGAFVGIYFSNLNQQINDTESNYRVWKKAVFEIQLVEEEIVESKNLFANVRGYNPAETYQNYIAQNFSIDLSYLDNLFDDIGLMKNAHERSFSAVKAARSNIRKMEKMLAHAHLTDPKVEELLQLIKQELTDLRRIVSWEAERVYGRLSDAQLLDFHEKLVQERAKRTPNTGGGR